MYLFEQSFGNHKRNRVHRGGENHIYHKLPNKVPAGTAYNEEHYNRGACRHKVCEQHIGNGEAEEDKHACVYNRRRCRRNKCCQNMILTLEELIKKTGKEACERCFYKADERGHEGRILEEDGCEGVEGHYTELNEHDSAVDKAERRTCHRAEKHRTEGDGDEHHAYSRCADVDGAYRKMKHKHKRERYGEIRHFND